jgi:hypothetical protein
MALHIFLLAVWYSRNWYTYPYFLNVLRDIERRICLFLLLFLRLFGFFFEELLELPHFLRVAAFVQILKCGTFAL